MSISFWVVIKPTKNSVLQDICFETNHLGLERQFKGGLQGSEISDTFSNETDAISHAKFLLNDIMPSKTPNQLRDFIAQMCENAQDHLDFKATDEGDRVVHLECTSYVVACFIAQNTEDGHHGVESDIIIDKLVTKQRTKDQWYEIIDKLAKSFGGWKK